jgi:hypothetical protein
VGTVNKIQIGTGTDKKVGIERRYPVSEPGYQHEGKHWRTNNKASTGKKVGIDQKGTALTEG